MDEIRRYIYDTAKQAGKGWVEYQSYLVVSVVMLPMSGPCHFKGAICSNAWAPLVAHSS